MSTGAGRASEADVNVSIGLLTMQVNFYTGENTSEKAKVKFRNCCPECYSAAQGTGEAVTLGSRYMCENGHGPFETSEVLKGAEEDGGVITIVGTSDEVKEERTEATVLEKKQVDLEFMLTEEVLENFYPADKVWVVQPKKAQPLFSALMAIMNDDGTIELPDGRNVVAVGQVRMRDSEHVVRLSKWGDQMAFQKLFRPEDCKVFPSPIVADVSDKNMEMIKTLIGVQLVDFNPETYTNQARDRLIAWKNARSTGVTINISTPKKADKDPDADLTAMLEAAVAAAKAS